MRKLLKLVTTLTFIAGCAAGIAAREALLVPPAAAQGANERFDYYCFADDSPQSAQASLKRAGQQGWELATTSGTFWCMKRRM